eukprot:gnl/Dysnectes_brevis/767_a844_3684.p1 GENE.gnl/Dysnectes_brevis/767_a844_3684~~gnl/Dysnectes_brevis/767_a844_3684.p1  ORF type:complete len:408 (-),score=77.67 gnl/Dysnectes_brevis/767_a844_3684:52-1122(-)
MDSYCYDYCCRVRDSDLTSEKRKTYHSSIVAHKEATSRLAKGFAPESTKYKSIEPLSMPVDCTLDLPTLNASFTPKNSDDESLILHGLRRSPMTCKYSESILQGLACLMEPVNYKAGDVIVQQGDPSDSFFIVSSGEAVIDRLYHEYDGSTRRVGTVKPGDYFGDRGVVLAKPRGATVTAASDCSLFRLDYLTYQAYSHLKRTQEIEEALVDFQQIPLLDGMDKRTLLALAKASEPAFHSPGDLLYEEGKSADRFYMISEGVLSVLKGTTEVNQITTGETFGESAMLLGYSSNATILVISEHAKTYSVDQDAFLALLSRCPLLLAPKKAKEVLIEGIDPSKLDTRPQPRRWRSDGI